VTVTSSVPTGKAQRPYDYLDRDHYCLLKQSYHCVIGT